MGLMDGQDREASVIKRRRQGENIMIWAGIYRDKLIGPFDTKHSLSSIIFKVFL